MKNSYRPRVSMLAAFVVLVLTVPSELLAQFRTSTGSAVPANPMIASYYLVNELAGGTTVNVPLGTSATSSEPGHKSPFLAAILSLAVPGLGEIYVGDDIWRGLIFTGVEAGLWLEMNHWTHRGDDTTAAFEKFSDEHWSTSRYADSLNAKLNGFHVPDSCNCYAKGSSIASINLAEATLDSLYGQSSPYGHRLVDPSFDAQQYYEMISKYDIPYAAGWDDRINFNQAASSRAEFNSEYDIARIFMYGIFLNHVLSAVDAALLARDHNSALRLHGDVVRQPMPNGSVGYVPTARIEYRF